jgi:hypothetical protein
MPTGDYDPNAVPVILATILERLNQQDKAARDGLTDIKLRIEETKKDLSDRLAGVKENLGGRIDDLKTKVDRTNGRLLAQEAITSELPAALATVKRNAEEVAKVKLWQANHAGKVAGISIAASAVVGFIGWGVDMWLTHSAK